MPSMDSPTVRQKQTRQIRDDMRDRYDPERVAAGMQQREELFGGDSQQAFNSMKSRLDSPAPGPMAAALSNLVVAETNRHNKVARAELYKPGGELATMAVQLLYKIAEQDDFELLNNAHVREGLSLAFSDTAPQTRDALNALSLTAYINDSRKKAKLVEFCAHGLSALEGGADDELLSAVTNKSDKLREIMAKRLTTLVPELCQQRLNIAKQAWTRASEPGAVDAAINALHIFADIERLDERPLKHQWQQACGPTWDEGVALIREIFHAQTLSADTIDVLRPSPTKRGWTTFAPFWQCTTEADIHALDRTLEYVVARKQSRTWKVDKAHKLMREIIKVFKEHGQGKRPWVKKAEYAMQPRRAQPAPSPQASMSEDYVESGQSWGD